MSDQRLLLLQTISETSLGGDLQKIVALSEQLAEITVTRDDDPEFLQELQKSTRRAASLLLAAQEGVTATRSLLENLIGRGRVNRYDSTGRMEKVTAGEPAPVRRL